MTGSYQALRDRKARLPSNQVARRKAGGADLQGIDLSWVYLRGANLSGANLAGANLMGSDLVGVDLTDADLSKVTCGGPIFTGLR
jgi:uncharacterized protein YjbI with pentapeptide repeats